MLQDYTKTERIGILTISIVLMTLVTIQLYIAII